MKISLFERHRQTEISNVEWTELMRRIRDGYWSKVVEQCRRQSIGVDDMRRRLPAFGISVTFIGGDAAANMVKYTHIMGIDFNKVFISKNLAMRKITECRAKCITVPSVVGFYTTKSGRGFRLFVKVNTGIAHHRAVYPLLRKYFENLLDLPADDKYRYITRLSFVSADKDCFFRPIEEAETFDLSKILPDSLRTVDLEDDGQAMSDVELKVVNYLSHKYDFRFNLMSNTSQFRVSDGSLAVAGATEWHDLDDHYTDYLVHDIYDNCTPITYNQFEWIRHDQVIEPYYDPVDDFFATLPAWDGTDHFSTLSHCEPLNNWIAVMASQWLSPHEHRNRALIITGKVPEWIGPSEKSADDSVREVEGKLDNFIGTKKNFSVSENNLQKHLKKDALELAKNIGQNIGENFVQNKGQEKIREFENPLSPTDAILHLIPLPLQQFACATSSDFIRPTASQQLLFIIEDFHYSQSAVNRLRYLRAANPRASFVIALSTTLTDSETRSTLAQLQQYFPSPVIIASDSLSTLRPSLPQLYSQILSRIVE